MRLLLGQGFDRQRMTSSYRRILVTGGAGFVGSHLVEALGRDKRTQIVSLDNYSSGRVKNHVWQDNVTYVRGHTRNIARLVPNPPDLVFHLGEYARVEQSRLEPDRVWASNLGGTAKVLEYCRIHRVPIVYTASSTKFALGGDGVELSPYTWAKAAITSLLPAYYRWYGLQYAVVYLYNVYGPRELGEGHYATVIGRFIRQYLEGRPLTVRSPGTQKRNFTHIYDAVDGLMRVSRRVDGREYHLRHPKKYTIAQVARMFGAPIERLPPQHGNRMDTGVIRGALLPIGWRPRHNLKDYIQRAINGHRQLRH